MNSASNAAARTEEEQFLSWLDDNNNDYIIEEDNKIKLLNFLKIILDKATNRKSSAIIHILAGNSQYGEEEVNNHSSKLLSFLDTMPDGTATKVKIYSNLNTIANLAKSGNTREIVSLLDIYLILKKKKLLNYHQ